MKHKVNQIVGVLALSISYFLISPFQAQSEEKTDAIANSIGLLQVITSLNPTVDFNQIPDDNNDGKYGLAEAIALLTWDEKHFFTSTDQLLVANGFENGLSPMGTWSTSGTISRDEGVGYNSGSSLKISRTSEGSLSSSVSQVYNVNSDSTRIRLSAMVRGDNIPLNTTIYCASETVSWMYGGQQSSLAYASDSWMEIENLYTCPAGATKIGIIFSHQGAIDTTLWIDDIKIEEIEYNQQLFEPSFTNKKIELPGVNLSANNASWPENWEIEYFANKGMKSIRIPITWELFQDELYGELKEDSTTLEYQNSGNTPWGNPVELNFPNLDRIIAKAKERGVKVLLDLHNYDRYDDQYLTSGAPLADFWTKLVTRYIHEDHLFFGIMNEPGMKDMANYNVETWVSHANAAIAAIRATGATQPVYVYWLDHIENVSYMLDRIVDPLDNYVWEVHAYIRPSI